jgi:hypothetical protein
MDFKVSEEGIVLAKWFDNKEVTVGSNHYSVNPTSQVNYLSSFFNSQVNYLSYFFIVKYLSHSKYLDSYLKKIITLKIIFIFSYV